MDTNAQAPAKILQQLHEALAQGVVVAPQTLRMLIVSLLCKGHVLLEDVPGVGKTTLAKRLAALVNVPFKRVQCTPDLLPADIIGVSLYDPKSEAFKFAPGPIFTSILLVDELNRASPRTQAAFLEAMAEGAVSSERKTRPLPDSFFMIATQNPVDFVGTYALPEAQYDRFFCRIHLGYPNLSEEVRIMQMSQQRADAPMPVINEESLLKLQALVSRIKIDPKLLDYIARLIQATRDHGRIKLGASPRASAALMQASQALALVQGQGFVTPPMVQDMIKPVVGHRLILRNPNDRVEALLDDIIAKVAAPSMPKEKTENG